MDSQCVELTLTLMFVFLFPIRLYLTIKQREWLAESRMQLGNLQILWQEVSDMNEEVVDIAKKEDHIIKPGPEKPKYDDLGTAGKRVPKKKTNKKRDVALPEKQ
jgi:hypothetical protein